MWMFTLTRASQQRFSSASSAMWCNDSVHNVAGSPGSRLQLNNLVIKAVGVHGIQEPVHQFPAVLRQKINAREAALLKFFSGIKRIADEFRVPLNHFAMSQLGTGGPGAKIVDLVEHFGFCVLRRLDQRLVEFRK